MGKTIQIGATGYAYMHTTDDKQNGAIVNGNGNRGRVFALGPSMTYIFTPRSRSSPKSSSNSTRATDPRAPGYGCR